MKSIRELWRRLRRWLLALLKRIMRRFNQRKYLFRLRPGRSNQRRRQWVKNLWLMMAGLMLIIGQMNWAVGLSLLTVFISFVILDEEG